MEIILREDIDKLGQRGQVINVAAGYARNYLLPKRLAVVATDSNKKIVAQEREAWLRKEAKAKSEFQDLAAMLSGVTVVLAAKAGENDQLFGSITAQNIADAVEKKGYNLDRRKILLDDPIKQIGEHKVKFRLHREVSGELTVQVVREE